MSTLTNTQIQNTYQGLLKLANSTTGITQNLQNIEDGLGNNTGLRITEDQLESPNIISWIRLKAQYYGTGFAASAGAQMASGTQNVIIAYPFYDSGLYSYSAMSFNLVTATTSSDTCEVAFYTSQMINPNGLYPYEPIVSGVTIPTTGSTGVKTVNFGSNLSFSGYGGGLYWLVFKISNSGVQPTVRFGNSQVNQRIGLSSYQIYGFTTGFTANSVTISRDNSSSAFWSVFSGTTTFDNPFTTSIVNSQSTNTNITGSNLGFVLHTTDY